MEALGDVQGGEKGSGKLWAHPMITIRFGSVFMAFSFFDVISREQAGKKDIKNLNLVRRWGRGGDVGLWSVVQRWGEVEGKVEGREKHLYVDGMLDNVTTCVTRERGA